MVTKAKLQKLEKVLKPEKKKKHMTLSSCEAKPGLYFTEALDTEREEPLGKVYTEKELPELEKKYELFHVHFVEMDMRASS